MSISNYGTKMQMEGRDLLLQTEVDPSLESDPININANFATDAVLDTAEAPMRWHRFRVESDAWDDRHQFQGVPSEVGMMD